MKVPRFTLLALVSCALVLAATTTAGAAPQGPWVLPASDVSAGSENASQPQLAVAPDGTVTTVWDRYDGSNWIVQAATRPAGGSFGTPVNLSVPGQNAYEPQIAVAPDGTVTAVWYRYDGSKNIIQAATRPAGGSFGTPVDLSAAGQHARYPQIAVAPDGTVTTVWRRYDGSNTIVQAATRPAGGSFGTPVNLSVPGQNAYEPQIAVAPDGTVTTVWYRYDGSKNIIQAATRPAGGSFGTPVNLSVPGQDAYDPQIAVAPDGATTVVWERWDGSNDIVQAATRPAGGSFGTPVNLSVPGQNAYEPQVTVAPDGTVTTVWRRYDGSNRIVQAATRLAGGSFGTPVNLSVPGQDAYDPQVAVAPDGTATAVWYRYDGSNWIVQAATRPAGGSFGTPVNLSVPGQNAYDPQIAVAPDGTVTTVWYRYDGTNDIIQAAWTQEPFELAVTRSGTGSGRVTSDPAGIDCGTVCSESFLPGTVVTLTASPDPGSSFTGWSGACTGTAPTCQVTMSGTRELTATFGKTPVPKPSVPVNPPDDSTAIYNPKTGKMKIRLKCGSQYRPKCLRMVAWGVTGKRKKARAMTSRVKAKNRRAGKWGHATLKVKPRYRSRVENMGNRKAKTLWVRIKVTFKKKHRKRARTIHHRYRVLVRE